MENKKSISREIEFGGNEGLCWEWIVKWFLMLGFGGTREELCQFDVIGNF